MNRPQHRVTVKDDKYYEQCTYYYRSVCIPAVDNRAVDIIFKAINGELDMADYSYVTNPLNSDKAKFKQYPSRIRNFDILSPVAMLLMGEKRRRGLRFTVVARNSNIETQKAQLEDEMTDKMLIQMLMQEFISIKQEQGEEVDIAQQEQITVEKIQKAAESVQDALSIQGQRALDYIRDFTEMDRKFIEGFYYWICTGRVFSFREPVNDEVIFISVSPKEMSYLASSEVRFMEDAEAVKRRVIMPLGEVIDKFDGTKGFDKIKESLESKVGTGAYDTLGQGVPPQGVSDIDPGKSAFTQMWNRVTGNNNQPYSDVDGIEVEHLVWDSYKKLGLVTSQNIYGEEFTEEVDSDFKPREGEKVEWHWVKIKCHSYLLDGRFVVGGEELPHTLSEIGKLPNSKNPYNGRLLNLRHVNPVGILQKGLAYQIKYNIIHYHIEKMMAKNMDKIVIFPLGLIADEKGQTMESTMYYAQSHGFMFPDETKKNFQTALNGVKVIDATLNAQIAQLYTYLGLVKQEWKELVGITPGREGQMQNSNDGKALMENSVFRSSVMTEEYFAEYEEYEQRDLQYLLEISKYAFKDGKKAMFINHDKARMLLELDESTFPYSDYLIRVANAGKDLEELERAKAQAQAMAQNTQGKFSAVLKVIRSNNISELIGEMEKMEAEFEANQQQMAERQNQVQEGIQVSKERVSKAELDYKYYDTDVKAETELAKAEMTVEASLLGNKTGDDSSSADMQFLVENNTRRQENLEATQIKLKELKDKRDMNRENNETKKYVSDNQKQIAKVNKN